MFDEFLNAGGLRVLPASQRQPYPPRSDRAAWEGLQERVKQELLEWGGEAREGYPALTATQFMAFVYSGDRQAYEKPYFERRRKLMGAVLAECVADDGSYMDAVIDGLWHICEETSWVISAHNVNSHQGMRPAQERPLPDDANPYVDLFAAQTCATLCYTLYFLEDKLDAVAPVIARRVRREAEKRVITPFMSRDDFWWMGFIRPDVNNWTPWILSNIIDSMLITEHDPIRLQEGLTRAMRMLDSYIAVLPPDGGCDEGCGYWNMAGASLLDCLEALYTATGGQADFYGEPLICAIGDFPLKAHIDGEYFWNFADCDAKPLLDGERLVRFGERTQNAPLAALGAEIFARRKGIRPPDTPQMNRVLNNLFNCPEYGGRYEPPREALLPQLGVYAWRRGGRYLAAKAGHNGESHNHNDLGSFIVYIDGEPLAVDAGNMVYTAKTFSPERYALWNTRSMNHSVPLIGGTEQREGAEHRVTDVRVQDGGVSMELREAYPKEAHIDGFRRSLSITDNGVTVEDDIALGEALPVTWVFMLRNRPELDKGCARMGQTRLEYSDRLTPAAEEIPITDKRMQRSYPGSLWRLTLDAPAATAHNERFQFVRS